MKKAFTLVEMLVVITIIGILAALVTGGTMAAMRRAKEAKIRMEMANFVLAIESYKQQFGEYPPDMRDSAAVLRHIKKRWPRFSLHAQTTTALRKAISQTYQKNAYNSSISYDAIGNFQPDQLGNLIFWLGGFPNQDGKFEGFNADPEAPFGKIEDTNGNQTTIIGNPNLTIGNNDTLVFTADNKTVVELNFGKNVFLASGTVTSNGITGPFTFPFIGSSNGLPFVYFRGHANGGNGAYFDSQNTANNFHSYNFSDSNISWDNSEWSDLGRAAPYAKEFAVSTSIVKWLEPEKYQLVHPGLDNKFNTGATGALIGDVRSIDDTNLSLEDYDNITNFTETRLDALLP